MNNEKILHIDQLIKESMINKDVNLVATLRLIKAKYMAFLTKEPEVDKDGNKIPIVLDDKAELEILNKMAQERKESISIYEKAGREELATQEKIELNIIKSFLPPEVTENQVKEYIDELVSEGLVLERKNMGQFMGKIKAKYPTVDGKMASGLLNKMF